ncbi:MAG: fibronectin type III domain-containing protein [Patescibacteria group bacterium]|nr:fibronectin type III domain-containing protein [Patescibacteria group bacterium]
MKRLFSNKIFYPICFLAIGFFVFAGLAGTAKADVVNTATSTSAVKDFSGGSVSIVFSWVATTSPGVTAVAMQVRSGSAASPDVNWTAWTTVANSGDSVGSSIASNRYFQYRAILTSTDISQVPTVDSVTITRNAYPATSTLVSSIYDSSSGANLIPKISWTAFGTSTNVDVEFQIRSSAASSTLLSAPWCGYADTGDTCAGTNYFDRTKNGAQITDANHPLMHGSNDRYFQYRATILSNGMSAPTFDDVTVTYVVNSPPAFASTTTAIQQTSDGKVLIKYTAYDPDTAASGVGCPNCVVATLRYSADNGVSWTSIPNQYFSTPAGANQGFATSTIATASTSYQILWDAKSQISGVYTTNAKIEITLNDREGGNNTAVVTTAAFPLDVSNPAMGTYPVIIDAHGAAVNGAVAHLTLSASDETPGLKMCVTLDGAYAGCTFSADYNSTSSIVLTADPKRVYVAFKDAYQNISTASAIAPEAPNAIIIRDVSDVAANAYQEFVVWKAWSSAAFKYYHVEHSTDGTTYATFTPISDNSVNFYFDQNLTKDNHYYYRVYTEDTGGNKSFYTSVVSDVADGTGGTNPNPPIISNVQVIATTTQSATIEWDTNELANSSVHYSLDLNYLSTAGSLSMLQDATHIGRHHVVLTDLEAGQTYHFTVESQNILGISGTDNNENNGYQFTTVSGPVISNVTANSLTNTGATIVWNTDTAANSTVYYTTSTSYTTFENAGDSAAVESHEVSLTQLTRGTTYYYYVESGVATDNNAGNYYTFSTPSDNVAPVINGATSTVITDTHAVINWITNELSDSRVVYGTQTGNYTLDSADTNLATDHKIILSSLASSTTYYYKVISIDASGNEASSTTELSFTTLQKLSQESDVLLREQQAEQTGETAGAASVTCPVCQTCAVCSGGGGIIAIDRTKPVISGLSVASINGTSVKVIWQTDKLANSLVQYGTTAEYRDGQLSTDLTKDHGIILYNLTPATTYAYRVSSIDGNGNLSQSGDLIFRTNDALGLPSVATSTFESISKDTSFISAMDKAASYLSAMANQVSVAVLESSLNKQYDLIRQLSDSTPAPLLSGEPKVITTSDTATVVWRTDKNSNSLVAIADAAKFTQSGGANVYSQVVGNSTEAVTTHTVTISDLQPETVYHYQVRSMTGIGALSKSGDFTFITKPKEL